MWNNKRTPSTLANQPIWVQGIAFVGFPSVAAIFLIYQLGSGMPQEIVAKLDAHMRMVETHTQETREGQQGIVRVLTQICVNSATTPEERAACWRAAQ